MSVDYSKIEPGQQISRYTYVLDQDTVFRYIEAVHGQQPMSCDGEERMLVPPMALAAMWLRGLVKDLSIPAGTLHVAQELEFKSAVSVGELVECLAIVVQNSVRRNIRFMVIKLQIEGHEGRRVMEGRGTLTLPES